MGMETPKPTPPIMSTLNPNASEFVPAAARPAATAATPAAMVESRIATTPVTVPVATAAPRVVAPENSSEWWNLIATDQAFREHYLSNCHFQSAEQRDALVDILDELADDYQFHGYQEHLVDLEEEEILRRNLAEIDCFLEEELRLTDANTSVEEPANEMELPKEIELQQQLQQQGQQQQRAPLSSNHYQYPNNKSMPPHNKVGSYPKKWNNTYRLHQPRTDM